MSMRTIIESEFPASGSTVEKLTFVLRYGILAPSAHNNQPWKAQVSEQGITIQADPEFTTTGGTPRLTLLTLGAFVENILEAAAHFGIALSLQSPPLTSKLTELELRLELGAEQSSEVGFAGILQRHTNRGLYQAELPDQALETLHSVQLEARCQAFFLTESADRQLGGKLAATGMQIALTLPPLKKQLSEFVHFEREQSETGMLAEAMVKDAHSEGLGANWVMNELPLPAEVAFCREKFSTAPLQVVISTDGDSFREQIAAGRSMQRLLNVAGSLNLTHCVAAAPIEVPVLAPQLRAMTKSPFKPQIFFRLGIPQDSTFTLDSPRRPVEQILKEK